MSHGNTCCLYKVTETIGPPALVWSQCIPKLSLQGIGRLLVALSISHCMCRRQANTALQRTPVELPRGGLRMSPHVWCMLVLFLCSYSKEMVLDKTRPVRWHSYQMENRQNIIRNLKRHSDGTFTSDFTHHLDKMKAKDFVEWLASTKRERCHEDLLKMAAEV